MDYSRESLDMLYAMSDAVLVTRREDSKFLDRVLWSFGQAYRLTMMREGNAKIILTAISLEHCLSLF